MLKIQVGFREFQFNYGVFLDSFQIKKCIVLENYSHDFDEAQVEKNSSFFPFKNHQGRSKANKVNDLMSEVRSGGSETGRKHGCLPLFCRVTRKALALVRTWSPPQVCQALNRRSPSPSFFPSNQYLACSAATRAGCL